MEEIIFSMVNNNYIGKTICPICKKEAEYFSDDSNMIAGCVHIKETKKINDSLFMIFDN